jgi:hypothetical protein
MMLKIKRPSDEDGIALVTVLLVTMILLLVVSGTMAYAIGSLPLSRHDQDWNAALTAAEAGLDDYLFRLNENDQYYLYSAAVLPPDGNQAFTTWVSVPDSNNASSFRYSVDTTNLSSQGAIVITATGRSGHVTRSVQATIRRRAFIDYLYFTDYETTDPAVYPVTGFNNNNSAWAQTNCAKHYYESRPSAPPYDNNHCVDLNFVTGDNITGDVHSNDALLICGNPVFSGNVTTSWKPAVGNKWRGNNTCTNNPTFKPGDPRYADPLTMPPNDVAVKVQTTPPDTGCLYTGPTSITFNSNGTMDVNSPFTKPVDATHNNCATGSGLQLPADGVIYVQNVPSTASDYNYTNGCISSTQIAPAGQPPVTVQHPLGYPQLGDITSYGCRNGDVFVQGTLKGRITVAADNNIDIVGNLSYQGGAGGNDILGLVANNYVEIYHPVGYTTGTLSSAIPANYCNGGSFSGNPLKITNNNTYCNLDDLVNVASPSTAFQSPTINAALLAVVHTIRVQNYQYGDSSWAGGNLASITVNGALAQKYRGAVGTSGGASSSGYLKAYGYDQRLKYQSPPHFLNPVASAWGIVTWIEQAAAYLWSAP